ncbi:MAG: tRNA pseudouridine(38-40) synthase TruA [Flavobacteriaceae bacterium]|nr:tRNA pseudouridine(38-40) synthase TruA [Bacteroidia bacterium]NNK83441.1 tRNA pseudouridine(38-40) synthase TruA [Flavobacteriaceae bacterium]
MRYFIELSYNGKSFHGWQNQPNAITVQSIVEDALSKLLSNDISIVGAGRTDTGVHAQQMFAHFDSNQIDCEIITFKLNSFLPKTIAIHNIFEVSENAHARFDALSRSYIYRISKVKDVFEFDNAYYFKNTLDVNLMNSACRILFDYKDFKCFSRTHTDVKTYNCKIMEAKWNEVDNELHFHIKADRFLRNMVRAIVGTMLDIGTKKIEVSKLHEIIESRDRSQAGASAPAHGLYLSKIEYSKEIIG